MHFRKKSFWHSYFYQVDAVPRTWAYEPLVGVDDVEADSAHSAGACEVEELLDDDNGPEEEDKGVADNWDRLGP